MEIFISSMLVQIFGCSTVDNVWKTLKPGICINKGPVYLASSIFNMSISLLILLLPIPMLIKLHVRKRTKAVPFALFAVLDCIVVINAVRVWATIDVARNPDITWASAPSNTVLVVELNMTVICACVMVLRPLWRKHLPFGSQLPYQTPLRGSFVP